VETSVQFVCGKTYLAPLYMSHTLNATIECMREQHARLPCAVSATDTGWLIRSHLVEQMLWLGAGHYCCLGGYRQGAGVQHTHSDTLTGVAANAWDVPAMHTCM
jgi:hypothetical protein